LPTLMDPVDHSLDDCLIPCVQQWSGWRMDI